MRRQLMHNAISLSRTLNIAHFNHRLKSTFANFNDMTRAGAGVRTAQLMKPHKNVKDQK